MGYLEEMKLNLRESDCPFFTDEELTAYYQKNGSDVKKATYECLIVKSQDTTLSMSGLTCADTSKYFLRLASMYQPNNSGVLRGNW